MKAIIAGGRDYEFEPADDLWLDGLRSEHGITEVVTGGATGADRDGDQWAMARGIPRRTFPADWATHGRAAGRSAITRWPSTSAPAGCASCSPAGVARPACDVRPSRLGSP